jgi:putative membrane protein
MTFLRYLSWLLRAFLFIVLLLFALKNTMPVRLSFLFDTGWEVPLIVLLLAFFALGIALGVMACLGPLVRQRREIGALNRQLEAGPGRAEPEPPRVPPELGM